MQHDVFWFGFFFSSTLITSWSSSTKWREEDGSRRKRRGDRTGQDCPEQDSVRIVCFSRSKGKKRAKDRRVGRRRRRWRMTGGACCSRNHQEEWWMQAGGGEVRWKRDNNEWDWDGDGRETNNPVTPPLCGVQEPSGQMDERRDGWVGGRRGRGGGKVWKRENKVRRDSALTRFIVLYLKHKISDPALNPRSNKNLHFLISL